MAAGPSYQILWSAAAALSFEQAQPCLLRFWAGCCQAKGAKCKELADVFVASKSADSCSAWMSRVIVFEPTSSDYRIAHFSLICSSRSPSGCEPRRSELLWSDCSAELQRSTFGSLGASCCLAACCRSSQLLLGSCFCFTRGPDFAE